MATIHCIPSAATVALMHSHLAFRRYIPLLYCETPSNLQAVGDSEPAFHRRRMSRVWQSMRINMRINSLQTAQQVRTQLNCLLTDSHQPKSAWQPYCHTWISFEKPMSVFQTFLVHLVHTDKALAPRARPVHVKAATAHHFQVSVTGS
jgi:hypothetical protein